MTRLLPRLVKSEGRIRHLMGYLALLIAPPLVVLLVIATKFHGLESNTAIDFAQLARNISTGNGFTTDLVRPLSLVFRADLSHHPDLYNAPVYPQILAFFFGIVHPGERVIAAVGGLVWILTVWLTYVVALLWFGRRVAVIATLFWSLNVAGLTAATEGLPGPVMTIPVLLAAWLALSRPDDQKQETGNDIPAWRVVLVGLACAIAFLTHYGLIAITIVLGAILIIRSQRKWRTLGVFGVGFLAPVVPWFLENARSGAGGLGLYWYETMTGTATYPGDSIWRTLSEPPVPLLFLLEHPAQMTRKLIVGLGAFRLESFRWLDPFVLFLFVAVMWFSLSGSHRRRAAQVVAVSMVLGVIGSCLLRPDPSLLLAWAPLVGILGAAYFDDWVMQHINRSEAETVAIPVDITSTIHKRRRRKGDAVSVLFWRRLGVRAGMVALVAFPLIGFLGLGRPSSGLAVQSWAMELSRVLPAGARVMTDQPAAVAWYGHRTALMLCQHESELDQLERLFGPVEAMAVTPAIMHFSPQERGDWWQWIASPRGVYRGLAPAREMPANTLLRIRPEEPS